MDNTTQTGNLPASILVSVDKAWHEVVSPAKPSRVATVGLPPRGSGEHRELQSDGIVGVRQESGFVPPPTGLSGTVAQVTRSGSDKPLKEEVMSTNALGPRGLIRQGDVLLIPVDAEFVDGAAPANRRVLERVGRSCGVGGGRGDGACARDRGRACAARDAELRRVPPRLQRRVSGASSRTVLIVEGSPATIVHEEHDPLTVSPGGYLVRRQREYVPAERESARWRRVAD